VNEIVDITPKLQHHWEAHLESALRMQDRAEKMLAQIALQRSGQISFGLESNAQPSDKPISLTR
jgi:hypothetical protein